MKDILDIKIDSEDLSSNLSFDDLPDAMFATLRVKHKMYFGTHGVGRTDVEPFDIEEFAKKFSLVPLYLQKGKDKSFQNSGVFYKEDKKEKTKFLIKAATHKTYGLPGEGTLNIQVAGTDVDKCIELCYQMIDSLVVTEPPEDHIKTTFWTQSAHGPVATMKRLKCPTWEELQENYAEPSRAKLEKILTGGPPVEASGLILWTGEPGTGKTTALRAMIREWSKFATAYVITDPENFLNDVNYVNEVVIEDEDSTKPILLIMEDAGELISADARGNTGQALSRLLNITDGLLGQGMNLYVLITTNEQMGKLHNAVKRKGRCISNIEFTTMSKAECEEWLESNGVNEYDITTSATLAELYSIKKGDTEDIGQARKLGFSAA